jgi:hypothetical protein
LEGGVVDGDAADLEGRTSALAVVAGGFACTGGTIPTAAHTVAAIIGFVSGAGGAGSASHSTERGGAVGDAGVIVTTAIGARGGVTDALSVDTTLSSDASVICAAFAGASVAGVGALGIAGDAGISADATRGGGGDGALSCVIATTCGVGAWATSAGLRDGIAGLTAGAGGTSDAVFAAACVGITGLTSSVGVTTTIGARGGITDTLSIFAGFSRTAGDASRARNAALGVGGGGDTSTIGIATTVRTGSGVAGAASIHTTLSIAAERGCCIFFVDGAIAVVVFAIAALGAWEGIANASAPFAVRVACLHACFAFAFAFRVGGACVARTGVTGITIASVGVFGVGLAVAIIVELIPADLFFFG